LLNTSEELLRKAPNGSELLLNGNAPREGEIMKNIYLAEVLELISKEGKVFISIYSSSFIAIKHNLILRMDFIVAM
jgi:gamma-glutamyltranspeptidase